MHTCVCLCKYIADDGYIFCLFPYLPIHTSMPLPVTKGIKNKKRKKGKNNKHI